MESKLEDIAQMTGHIDYSDVSTLLKMCGNDDSFKKTVRALINKWEDAMEDGDDKTAEEVAAKLKEYTSPAAYNRDEVIAAMNKCLELINGPEGDRLGFWRETQDTNDADGRPSAGSVIFWLKKSAMTGLDKKPRLCKKAEQDLRIIEAGCNGLLFNEKKFTLAYNACRTIAATFGGKSEIKYMLEFYLMDANTRFKIQL